MLKGYRCKRIIIIIILIINFLSNEQKLDKPRVAQLLDDVPLILRRVNCFIFFVFAIGG